VKTRSVIFMAFLLCIATAAGAITQRQVERMDQIKKEVTTLFREGKFEQALPLLNEAAAIDPLDKTITRWQTLARQQAFEPICRDAAEAFQAENFAKAIETWDKLLKMNPDDRRISSLIETTKNLITDKTTSDMYLRAEQFMKDNDYRSAMNELEGRYAFNWAKNIWADALA